VKNKKSNYLIVEDGVLAYQPSCYDLKPIEVWGVGEFGLSHGVRTGKRDDIIMIEINDVKRIFFI
jgi:hypothetical protein